MLGLRVESGRVLKELRLSASDDGVSFLSVKTGEGTGVKEKTIENAPVHRFRLGRDGRLVGEDDVVSCPRIGREQSPVDEAAVAQVRVVDLLSRPFEYLGDELLSCRWSLDEELDRRGEQSELDLLE